MPSVIQLESISDLSILIGLIVTAACIVLIADWRLALFALAAQYVLLALLLTRIVQPQVATVRVIAGGLAAAILYLTMRRRDEESRAARRGRMDGEIAQAASPIPVFIVSFAFRMSAVALVAVTLVGFAGSMTFLDLAPYVLFSSLWLMAIGIVAAMFSRDVLRLGIGILVFTGGFSILDTAVEGSLFLYGLLNIADLLIAVVVAHLATLASEGETGIERGELP